METWIKLMIRRRYWVMGAVLAVTVGLTSQIGHLAVIVNTDDILPQSNHYVQTGREIESTFGNKFTVAIAVTAAQGTIYQTPILEKLKRITARLMTTPAVIQSSIVSLSARKVKNISGNDEGMVVRPLMDAVPRDEAGI